MIIKKKIAPVNLQIKKKKWLYNSFVIKQLHSLVFLSMIVSWLAWVFPLVALVIHFYKDNDDNFKESIILIYKMISLAIDNSNYMLTIYGGHYLNPQIYSDI